jgi:hypothetical protein
MTGRHKRRGRYFKQKEWPEEISRIAIRQHDNLDWALLIFGPRVCAREIVRRHRIECAQNNCKYDRGYAIDQAAKTVGLDREKLVNWLNRSKRARNAKRYGSSSPV